MDEPVTTDIVAAPGRTEIMPAVTTRLSQAMAVLREAKGFADLLSKSEFIPKAYRGRPADIMACVMLGESLGLGPMQAMMGIAVINGRPAIWGDAAMAVSRAHPEFADCVETLAVGRTEEECVATCVVTRRGQTPVERKFSVADAKKAKLWGKAGPWTEYPKRMLQMRARGFALRDAFADALMGIAMREEAEDVIDVQAAPVLDALPQGRRVRLTGRRPAAPEPAPEPEPAPTASADPVTWDPADGSPLSADTRRLVDEAIDNAPRHLLDAIGSALDEEGLDATAMDPWGEEDGRRALAVISAVLAADEAAP